MDVQGGESSSRRGHHLHRHNSSPARITRGEPGPAATPSSSHGAATRVPKGWKGVAEVRKFSNGETERENRESRQNNLYFVTSPSCSYIGQRVTAGNFLERASWLNSSRYKWLAVSKAEAGVCGGATGLYTYTCINIYGFCLSDTKWFRGKQEWGSQ